jgi:DNA polymerase-4
MAARLAADGINRIADLQALGPDRLGLRYGHFGRRLAALATGADDRVVVPDRDAKGISAETTFDRDLSTKAELEPELWRLCERVSGRSKNAGLAGRTVVLKLKTDGFRILTRRHGIGHPTQLADILYRSATALLAPEIGRRRYRLIGVGLADLVETDSIAPDLFAAGPVPAERVERVLDEVRARFGRDSIGKGRGLRPRTPPR